MNIVALVAGIIVLFVSLKTFENTSFSNPIISICIGVLVAVSMSSLGSGLMTGILLPYKALGLTIPVFLLLPLFLPRARKHEQKNSEDLKSSYSKDIAKSRDKENLS